MPQDKRYLVFVSSTYTDLVEERAAVMRSLLQLECMPAGMELFSAANDDSWDLIEREITGADYYVLIIGNRYGSLTEQGVSYTEREYDLALEMKVPIISFIHGEPQQVPVGKSEVDPKIIEKLGRFKEKVKKNHNVLFWRSTAELAGLVTTSLVSAARNNPRTGWVRADQAATPEMMAEIATLRYQLSESRNQNARQSTAKPAGIEKYAQGDEFFKFDCTFMVSPVDNHWQPDDAFTCTIHVTWDEIVNALAPLLADETTDNLMKQRLRTLIFDHAAEKYAFEYAINKSYSASVLSDDQYETVKTQLIALQIIMRGVKKRAPSDKKNYWTLTEYGQSKLIELRAIPSEHFNPSSNTE